MNKQDWITIKCLPHIKIEGRNLKIADKEIMLFFRTLKEIKAKK